MVYYNLSQLWGSVPYITVPATSNNYDEILHSPVRSPQDLCWGLLNELQDITRLPEGGWRITMETVKALRAEIALSLGYNDEAGYLLRDCELYTRENRPAAQRGRYGGHCGQVGPAGRMENAEARLGLLDHVETDRAGTGRGRMRSLRASHAFSAIRNKPFARAYAKSGILTTGKCGTRHGQFRPVGTV